MNVNGVAAVVTGAASGLGEATARELAVAGPRSPYSTATPTAVNGSRVRSAGRSAKSM